MTSHTKLIAKTYLIVCETLFLFVSLGIAWLCLASPPNRWTQALCGLVFLAIAALCLAAIVGIARKAIWARTISFALGLIVGTVSLWIIWLGYTADDKYGDAGEVAIFGFAFLLFALPAFMCLSALDCDLIRDSAED